MTDWQDCEHYWLHNAPQGTEAWKNARKGRVTASMAFSTTGDYTKFYPTSPDDPTGLISVAKIIAGITEKEFTEVTKARMNHGTRTEPIAREWYARERGVEVLELGLAVPKWDKRIGASTDGVVVGTDRIIEIKCPEKMYEPLKSRRLLKKMGLEFDQFDHEHIWESHYAQMQMNLAVLGKKWCDYIVYTPDDINVEEIEFNPDYWYNYLYPRMDRFIKTYLDPLLVGTNLPSNP